MLVTLKYSSGVNEHKHGEGYEIKPNKSFG
jgi:hypothetical protein